MAFCTKCGKPVSEGDNFCGSCGHPQDTLASSDTATATTTTTTTMASAHSNWRENLEYHSVISTPDVRQQIEVASGRGKDNLSANDITKLLSPLLPTGGASILGVASKSGYKIAASGSLSARREVERNYDAPPGQMIGALACVFAASSYDVQDVQESADQVMLLARVPVGLISAQFLVEATITASDAGTHARYAVLSVLWPVLPFKRKAFFASLDAEMDRYVTALSPA